jgi:steroid delta-isomerase-like uncharacterized protein
MTGRVILLAQVRGNSIQTRHVQCPAKRLGAHPSPNMGSHLTTRQAAANLTASLNSGIETILSSGNKQIVGRKFDALNEGNLAALDEVIGEEIIAHDPAEPAPLRGFGAYRAAMDAFLSSFVGLRVRIDDQIEQDDKVVTRWSITARHAGEAFGLAPTGKEVAFTGIDIHRIENRRIVEEWSSWDTFGLMRQLGPVPEREE